MAESWPTARELMTPDPITLAQDAPLSQALGTMRARAIHELPVLRGKRLLGLITFESIARRSNLPLSTKVEHLLLLPPLVTPATTLPEVAEQLVATGLRAAPVVGKGSELVGIISRTDLVKAIPRFPAIAAHPVGGIASPVGLLVKESDSVGSLFGQIRLLEEHPLPVIDRKGRLVGAVGIADLGRVLWRPSQGGKRDVANRGNPMSVEISTIMHSPALTVAPEATAGEAAKLMTRERVSSVFVVEGGKPIGVVSQADLLSLAVGAGGGQTSVGDVYVQVTGLRGSGDPAILAEIDELVAKGLRHIARHVQPRGLSLHVAPHGNHRTGDANVSARLITDQGVFFANQVGWNLFAGIASLLDELEQQVRRAHGEREDRRKRRSPREIPTDDEPADPEVEALLRQATESD
jgi:CBS domain-containing protein/ribosome-associated translation inhibitor RaiA